MIAWRLEAYEALDSTSDFCVARAKAGVPAGLAVLAARQMAGRGSRGRGWTAPAGNLNLSVLLRPRRPAAEAGLYALLAGIAVSEALEMFLGAPPMLKWPNDILIGTRKLGGILIDAAPSGNAVEWLVIGIGLNLRAAPEIPGRSTTSLADQGVSVSAEDAAASVLARLGAWHEAPADAIRDHWLARAHPLGTPLTVKTPHAVRCGSFAGLSAFGELLLADETRIEPISTGDVLLGLV